MNTKERQEMHKALGMTKEEMQKEASHMLSIALLNPMVPTRTGEIELIFPDLDKKTRARIFIYYAAKRQLEKTIK